jgi:hypothetical protein
VEAYEARDLDIKPGQFVRRPLHRHAKVNEAVNLHSDNYYEVLLKMHDDIPW